MNDDDGLCGRPTRSGTPCRNPIVGRLSCMTHRTAEDERLIAAYREGFAAGESHEAELERRRVERRAQRAGAVVERRYETPGGAQIVEVDGYAYQWRGRTLVV